MLTDQEWHVHSGSEPMTSHVGLWDAPDTSVTRIDGVVIVDSSCRLVWWNDAMQRRLVAVGTSWHVGMPCCEALDCSRNTRPGEDCLTRIALSTPAIMSPRPWRTEGAGDGVEGTLVARPLGSAAGNVVVFEVHVPPAELPGPRIVPSPAALDIGALGRLTVLVGGRSRGGDWLQQRPGQVFRYLLASRAGPERSESIASALWPERGPSAVANVRYCIFKLREHLGERDDPGASAIIRNSGGYRIDPERLTLDVDVFQRQATAGLTAHRGGDQVAAEAALTDALALYRGDFLSEDPYADWAFTEREYLRNLAGKGLAALAQISVAGGRLVAAADHLQRLARLEPFDSRVHQMLIEVCLRRGRRTEAMRHYHALRSRLQQTFGEAPDFELAAVAAGVAAGRTSPLQRAAAPLYTNAVDR
jgi:DNA-binding SARP family transcriptional activator